MKILNIYCFTDLVPHAVGVSANSNEERIAPFEKPRFLNNFQPVNVFFYRGQVETISLLL